jgi:hypothetical protein
MKWHFTRKPVFVGLWQEACEIQEPAKNEKRQPKPSLAPILAAEPDGKPDIPLPPLPPTPYEIEKGLHRALPEMPPQVAAFLLHAPRIHLPGDIASHSMRGHSENSSRLKEPGPAKIDLFRQLGESAQ